MSRDSQHLQFYMVPRWSYFKDNYVYTHTPCTIDELFLNSRVTGITVCYFFVILSNVSMNIVSGLALHEDYGLFCYSFKPIFCLCITQNFPK